jgi:cholesterol oxidase
LSANQYDFLIIGSGFGGSVCAMRLAQKGYRVAVLENGKRWYPNDFPESNWNFKKYFWIPLLRCFGIQQITLLKGVMVLHGTGVGGGSLVYANTLMKPPSEVFRSSSWPSGCDWEKELEPHYEVARKMLGATTNTAMMEGEDILRRIGERLGVASTFHPTEVGVYFGEPGKTVVDPYFSGLGPDRTGCILCGGCMIGCRHGAKNTLDMNYLYFAEKWGTQIFPETKATRIVPQPNGFMVETENSTSWLRKRSSDFYSKRVILAAGVLGSVEILLKNRDRFKTLPAISPRLGERVRTNGESLLGATSFEAHRDLSRGIAIGAAIRVDAETRIEIVRYPAGSGAMKLLGVPLTENGTRITRPFKMFRNALNRFPQLLKLWVVKDWARSSLILMVMQSVDRQMRLRLGRSILSGFQNGLQGTVTDQPIPSYLPIAQTAGKILAEEIGGEPQNIISEVLLGTPATAHILGGCCMGDSREEGVINRNHEVFGYPGLYVCDGSVIPSNLSVNPSLTITAFSERFCTQFPALRDDRKIVFSK